MQIIYVDSVFFLNYGCDVLLLLCAERVSGVLPRRMRCALSALPGGIYAVACYLEGFSFLRSALWKLLIGLTMSILCFAPEEKPMRGILSFFAVSAVFGGVLTALSFTELGSRISLRGFLIAFFVTYALFGFAFRARAKLGAHKRCTVTVELGGKRVTFPALCDSGNELCDPATGERVSVVHPEALRELFGAETELLYLSPVEAVEKSAQGTLLQNRLRLCPYRSIGGSGLLAVFTPERLWVNGKEVPHMAIGASALARGEDFEAIIG